MIFVPSFLASSAKARTANPMTARVTAVANIGDSSL
jgi:hypothetical protein